MERIKRLKRETVICSIAVFALLGWSAHEWIESTRIVHASGILSLPSTVVQTNQSNAYTTGTQNFAAAVHTAPTIVVANVGALPASGCVNGELAVVTAATVGQQIYENSTVGSCTWTQQLNTGSSSGGGVITYSGAGITLTGTLFFPAGGGGVPSGTESNVDLAASSAGTITNLTAQMSVAPGMGNSVAITWRKNNASQSSTCTISGASATECQDTTHSFSVSQGDTLDYQVIVTGVIAGTPSLAMMSQYGSTLSGGSVNAGSAHQTALYSSAGTAVSGAGPGTSGQVWTSNGAGSDPTFQAAAGGGGTITVGAYSTLPACTSSSYVFIANDAPVNAFCNGSSTLYQKYGPFKIVPPVLGDTVWFNQTSAAISAVPAGVVLTSSPGSGNNNVNARLQAYPSTPFTQIACFDGAMPPSNFASLGMFISDGTNVSTSKLVTSAMGNSSSGSSGGTVASVQTFDQRFTNVTTATANPTYVTYGVNLPICFAIQDDGSTNRKLAFSYDRQNWFVTLTEARTTFLTPADIGYYVNTGSSGLAPIIHLVSWELVGSTLF